MGGERRRDAGGRLNASYTVQRFVSLVSHAASWTRWVCQNGGSPCSTSLERILKARYAAWRHEGAFINSGASHAAFRRRGQQ